MPSRDEITEQILQLADIVDIVGDYVDLKKRGRNFVGLCPFHNEKTPSFNVSPELGIYKCFGCGKSGNVFSFLMDYQGLSFGEAKETLAKRVGISLSSRHRTEKEKARLTKKDLILNAMNAASSYYSYILRSSQGKTALDYFRKREFKDETLNNYHLGYAPDSWDATLKELKKQGFDETIIMDAGLIIAREEGGYYDRFRGRAIFPIKDYFGRVAGFGARILSDDKTQPKYINSPQTLVYDKSKILYGLFEAKNQIRNLKAAILVEGYADVLTLHQAGIMNAVASSGTSLTVGMLQLLKRLCDKLYFVYDADSAGVKAAERGLEQAIEQGYDVNIAILPPGDDPDSLVRKHGKEVFQSYIRDAHSFLEFKIERYKNEGLLQTPLGKAKAARELMGIISRIPDRLQHDFFINQIRAYLDLSEEQFKQIYKEKAELEKQKRVKEKADTEDKTEVEHPELSSKPIVKENEKDDIGMNGQVGNKQVHIDLSKMYPEEMLILHCAINGANGLKLLLDKFRMTERSFLSEEGRHLFNILSGFSDSRGVLMHNIINSADISEMDKESLSTIALREEPSIHWKEFGSKIPELDIEKNIYNSLIKLELKFIEMKLPTIQSKLKQSVSAENELKYLIEIKELNLKRQKLINKLIS